MVLVTESLWLYDVLNEIFTTTNFGEKEVQRPSSFSMFSLFGSHSYSSSFFPRSIKHWAHSIAVDILLLRKRWHWFWKMPNFDHLLLYLPFKKIVRADRNLIAGTMRSSSLFNNREHLIASVFLPLQSHALKNWRFFKYLPRSSKRCHIVIKVVCLREVDKMFNSSI